MDVTAQLTAFLRRRPDLLPPGVDDPFQLSPAHSGSSGDVWILAVSGSPRAIVRRCERRRAAKRLLWAHGLASLVAPEAGARPLPRLLASDLSWWRTRKLGGPVLLEEYLEGEDLDQQADPAQHAAAVAAALAAIHAVHSPTWGGFGADPEWSLQSRLRQMITRRLTSVHAMFSESERRLLEQWLEAALAASPRHERYSLVHTQIGADDIRIRPGGAAVLIDIGSLQWGPPEGDLVAAMHALGLAEGDGEPLLTPYLRGWAEADSQALRARLPLFRGLHDLSKLRARLRGGMRDPQALEIASIRARLLALPSRFPLRSHEQAL